LLIGVLDSYDATSRKGEGQVWKGEQVMTLTVDVFHGQRLGNRSQFDR
jgi:hypothetical protein